MIGSLLMFHAIIGPMNNFVVLRMLAAVAEVAAQVGINAQVGAVAASALWAFNPTCM